MKKRRSPGKRPGPRKENQKVLVLCEGETEVAYFEGLKGHLKALRPNQPGLGRRPDPVDVERARRTAAKLIVQEALNRRAEGHSQIWAVFDTEGQNVTPLRRQVQETPSSPAEAEVHTAVSHPAFEIWLLLHHLDCGRLHGCHGPEDSEKLLKATVPSWAKGERRRGKAGTGFSDFEDGLDHACGRAERTTPDHYGDYPWTDVHKVVHVIRAHFPVESP
ncbi:RloB family protein [Nocardiopsis dassonvillei]|uniref:RloB family protein n=1 Tax=Nocardiopsis dassonvillei TaxID=2014 RepID=UPI00200E598C|nr:RloB family protein [Nocardiopsis dassonvillei]MCK9872160.1 RloB family protein [Nocardiopsis dassonvillei]